MDTILETIQQEVTNVDQFAVEGGVYQPRNLLCCEGVQRYNFGLSAFLTTTMNKMIAVLGALKEVGVRSKVRSN